MTITVTQLFYYPVKSLAGIARQQLTITDFGPHLDRRWMIVDSNGNFITQRQYPELCLITVSNNNEDLVISEKCNKLSIIKLSSSEYRSNTCSVKVWGDTVAAIDCGDAVAQWLSDYIGEMVRLVYMPESTMRLIDEDYNPNGQRVSFADGFPILLTNSASLEAFNQALEHPIKMQNFRPNLVINGAEAYAEDAWRKIKIGDMILEVVKPCSRCVIPAINPETAEKQPEVLCALAKYRKRGNAVYFGQNVIARSAGSITVGDSVEVLV